VETGNQTGQVVGLNNDHLVELKVIETSTSSMRNMRSSMKVFQTGGSL
jgi:hypothetical protein